MSYSTNTNFTEPKTYGFATALVTCTEGLVFCCKFLLVEFRIQAVLGHLKRCYK